MFSLTKVLTGGMIARFDTVLLPSGICIADMCAVEAAKIDASMAKAANGEKMKVRVAYFRTPWKKKEQYGHLAVSGGLWLEIDLDFFETTGEQRFILSGSVAIGPKGEDGYFDTDSPESEGYRLEFIPHVQEDILTADLMTGFNHKVVGKYERGKKDAVETM